MMRRIIGSSLKFRLMVLPLAAVLAVAGFLQLRRTPVDILPEFTPPTVQIQTEALGLSAVEVEQFITVPMEQDLLNGVPWLDTIRSQSVAGLSRIDLVFRTGTDVLRARQAVQERLTQAVALPHVSKAPVMLDPVSSSSRVMVIGLASTDMSLIDMSVLARWRIRPRLMGVPGVANVSVWGQRDRQLQVQVDPERLTRAGVTLDQVLQTTGNALWVSPLTFVEASTPGTGGFLETPDQRLTIQHVLPITTAADLAQVPLEDTAAGRPLRLGDVAQVVEDHQPLIGEAVVGAGPGLMLVVEKAPGASTLEVTRGIEDALRALGPGLAGVRVDTAVYRPATYLESAIGTVGAALLLGLILMIAVLALVFADWRAALTTLVAVVLSVATAILVLYLRGGGVNTLVLAGLVVALGVLVDDAVDTAHAVRDRLRDRRPDPASRAALVVAAVHEARGWVGYATLTAAVAAVPLLLLGGVTGALTRPLAVSYLLAIAASATVAVTVTPALALTLAAGPARPREAPVLRWLRRGYGTLLARTIGWRAAAILTAALVTAAGALLLPHRHGALLPPLRQRDLLITWSGTPSMSQGETTRIAAQVGAELRGVPGVRSVGAHIGRAVTSDQVAGVNAGEFWVSIAPAAGYDATLARVRRVLAGYPGFEHHLLSYTDQQVTEAQAGTPGNLTVRLYGPDLDTLRAKAEEIRRRVARVPGVVDPRLDLPPEQPTIEIEVNLAAAGRYGIKPGDVRRATAVLLSGLVAGSLFEDQKVFDVVVLGTPAARASLTSIGDLLIDTPAGGHVRLADVAQVRIRPDPTVIRHDSVSRRVDIGLTVRGRSARSVAADVRTALRGVSYPVEYHAELLGQYARRGADRTAAWVLVATAGLVILLLLQAALDGWRWAWLLLAALPLAPAGAALTGLAAGVPVSLGSLIGLFAVWVLAARHALALLWTYRHLPGREGETAAEFARRGAAERFAPVVKTTLAVAVAVTPLAAAGQRPGLEMLRPLAIVLLGGLLAAALLNLFVLPALCLRGVRS
jgi:Cu/Ag efflux pump CusA